MDGGRGHDGQRRGNCPRWARHRRGRPRSVRLSELVNGLEGDCFAALVKKVRGDDLAGAAVRQMLFPRQGRHPRSPALARPSAPPAGRAVGRGPGVSGSASGPSCNPKFGMQTRSTTQADSPAQRQGQRLQFLRTGREHPVSTPPGLMEKIHGCHSTNTSYDPTPEGPRQADPRANTPTCSRRCPRAAELPPQRTPGGCSSTSGASPGSAGGAGGSLRGDYHQLDPPLNRGLIVAAAMVHDIGKLGEWRIIRSRPSTRSPGSLVGHTMIGRDLVRETAPEIEGVPGETLLLLDHAILSHHGKMESAHRCCPRRSRR